MRAKILVFLGVFVSLSNGWGQAKPSGLSPLRPPQASLQQMVRRHLLYSSGTQVSAYSSRRPLHKVKWTTVPAVSQTELQQIFENFRDHRPLQDRINRARRLTWLYPDDGCYARAEMMIGEAARRGHVKPAKIFVFGDLTVQSSFSPSGRVYWWYHVAPVLRVGTQAYVLDPAMEAQSPLTVEEWTKRMNAKVEVAVCSSHSYDPESPCRGVRQDLFKRASSDEALFLDSEWSRIVELGRSPEDDLGDLPPWTQPRNLL